MFNARMTLNADQERANFDAFNELLKEIFPRFRDSIRSRFDRIKQRKAWTIPELVAQRIELGFYNLYWEDVPRKANCAAFFMALFCNAYRRGNEDCKKELAERLRAYGKHGLAPLFLELSVGANYLMQGFVVDRTPGGGPDLKVFGPKRPLSIECKCISSTAGMPIKFDVIYGAQEILGPVINTLSDRSSSFPVMSVTYVGTRQVAAEQTDLVLESLRGAASRALAEGFPFENALWRLAWRPSEVLPAKNSFLSIDDAMALFPDEMELRPAFTMQADKGVIHLYGSDDHHLPKIIGREVRDALRDQLSPDGLNVVVVQICGLGLQYSPGSDRYRDFLVDRLLRPASTRKEILNCQFDLAGIFIIGDFFPSMEDGVSVMNYYGAFVESMQDANLAEFCEGYYGGDLSRLNGFIPTRMDPDVLSSRLRGLVSKHLKHGVLAGNPSSGFVDP